jgi:hypothetical protein
VFALIAFVIFVIAAVRDWFATAPTHQLGLLFIGLALLSLHLVWGIVLPHFTRAPAAPPAA